MTPPAADSSRPSVQLTWPVEGDLLWIWRGVKEDANAMYPAIATTSPFTLGGTLGVGVKWWAPDLRERTDFIALTHIEERRNILSSGQESR